jgi:hypothetical protein
MEIQNFIKPKAVHSVGDNGERGTQTFLGDIVGGALVTMGTRLPFEGLGRFVIVFGTLWHGQNRLGVGGCGEQVGLDPK